MLDLRRLDLKKIPLRQHRLFAHAESDEVLAKASVPALISAFEDAHLQMPYTLSSGNQIWVTRHLKDLQGKPQWIWGGLRFVLRSPHIPHFGVTASRLCPNVPIVYSSICLQSRERGRNFFYNGKEVLPESVPRQVAKQFAEILEAGDGIVATGDGLFEFFRPNAKP